MAGVKMGGDTERMKLRIKELRKQKGWSQPDLKEELGSGDISRLENEGCGLNLWRIEKLCQIFECTPNQLFDIYTDDPRILKETIQTVIEESDGLTPSQIATVATKAFFWKATPDELRAHLKLGKDFPDLDGDP